MKRLIAVILAGVMVLALAACGNSGNTPATTKATEGAETEAVTQPAGSDETEAVTEAVTEEETEAETEDPYADAPKEVVVGIVADPGTFYPWPGHALSDTAV